MSNVKFSINFLRTQARNQTGRPGQLKTLSSVPHPYYRGELRLVTWIGINDLLHDWSGIEGVQRQLDRLFELQHLIYDSGARNFIFFNVPPFERAPCCTQGDIRSRVRHWNSALFNHTSNFRSSHPDASIAIYDAAIVFNDILDDYGVYGFRDTTKVCGTSEDCVWADNIHPGSKVHEILAKDLSRALNMAGKLTNVLNVL